MKNPLVAMSFVSVLAACAGRAAPQAPDSESAAAPSAKALADELVVAPVKPAPSDLSSSEKAELSGTCNPLLTAMIEGEALGMHALDDAFRDGNADPDAVGLLAALERVKKSPEGLSPAEHQRCTALFEKQQRRKQYDHEPAEAEARSAVDACVKRVEAVYGKQSMAFDDGSPAVAQGPFCGDDFPVPMKLSQLPYQSTKEDWDQPTWRCLQFGLRTKQRVQVEYLAPIGSTEFTCIGRYLPRQGGAPVELYRGGKQGAEGQLLLQPKIQKRPMAAK